MHSEHVAVVSLECARCLDEADGRDRRRARRRVPARAPTFAPACRSTCPVQDEQPLIDDHHEIDLDEVLRQNILTNLPLRPLCEAACPGLCSFCGQRLDGPAPRAPGRTLDEQKSPVDAARARSLGWRSCSTAMKKGKNDNAMVALPKKKISSSRRGQRRSHDHISSAAADELPAMQAAQGHPPGLPELRYVQRHRRAAPRRQSQAEAGVATLALLALLFPGQASQAVGMGTDLQQRSARRATPVRAGRRDHRPANHAAVRGRAAGAA